MLTRIGQYDTGVLENSRDETGEEHKKNDTHELWGTLLKPLDQDMVGYLTVGKQDSVTLGCREIQG